MHRVDLCLWSLEISSKQARAAQSILADDEIARAEGFVRQIHRNRYIAGRAHLREILGAEMGCHPRNVVFTYGANGKPSVSNGPHFNLSHSGSLAILAISRDGEIGVDIEEIRPIEETVAQHHFSEAELQMLCELEPTRRLDGFFRIWTRKEAIIKACGLGLSFSLDSLKVSLSSDENTQVVFIDNDDASSWSLQHFEPMQGWVGAVAARTEGRGMTLRWRNST